MKQSRVGVSLEEIVRWPSKTDGTTATATLSSVDGTLFDRCLLHGSATVLALDDTGIRIRSEDGRKGVSAFCPAGSLPSFDCPTPLQRAVTASDLHTLLKVSNQAPPDRVALAIDDNQMTVTAGEFGGTIPVSTLGSQHHRLATYDFSALHDEHTASATVDDHFRTDVDRYGMNEELGLTIDAETQTIHLETPRGETIHELEDTHGSGQITLKLADVRQLYQRFELHDASPTFSWGENSTLALQFQPADWTICCYIQSS